MTAYLVFEALRDGKLTLKTKIPNTLEAMKQPPSKVGLPKGASLLVNTALKALIVKSANDVAVMLAQAVSGSTQAFANKMNATAKRLGMTRTHFVNPNGLPAKAQVTTARDLAKLSRAVVKEFPEYAHYWTLQRFRIGKIRLRSHNALLRTLEGADGAEDRLYLRFRFQHRGECDARRSEADGGGAWRTIRNRPQHPGCEFVGARLQPVLLEDAF